VIFRLRFWLLVLAGGWVWAAAAPGPQSFHFAILGDRTGEAQDEVYQKVWKQAAAGHPAFVVTVGDTIQGGNDRTAEAEWQKVEQILAPYRRYRLYLAPGNHDIWSAASEKLFSRYAGHPPHYGFDYGDAHFTVLDNSRSDEMPAAEIAFLETDLKAHASQPLKIIVSHRPSWIFNALAGNTDFPLHRLAKKYGVRYVIAGHLHEMLHFKLEGIDYVSMASAGGHLRATEKYGDGWFFGYATVTADRNQTAFRIHELGSDGRPGRVTALNAWGPAGLL